MSVFYSDIFTVGGYAPMALDAAGQAGAQSFLIGELERRDPRLNEPLQSFTWMRDIVADTGGGWVDYSSALFVDYATSGANEFGIIAGETTQIPLIQSNVTKDTYKIFNFANAIKVPFIDQQKMMTIGRSLDQQLDEGLRINYNKMIDRNVYLGFSQYGTYGLVNNPAITASLAANNAAASSKLWTAKTPDEILQDVNTILYNCWAASEFDPQGIPNHIGLPPLVWSAINTRLISSAGSQSILSYLENNNLARAMGVDLKIVPMRQLIGVGLPLTSGGAATNRMIAYRNDPSKLGFDIPVPLGRVMTQPVALQLAYITVYASQVGQVKVKYPQTAYYLDGI